MHIQDISWNNAPAERDPCYFRAWQQVSIALQKALRAWIPEMYFRDNLARYENRDMAGQLMAYEACRVCYGRPKTEFTYDVADPATVPAALRMIGRPMQTVLERIEKTLREAGRLELARRYAPVWYEDILAVARAKPKRLVGLLAHEAAIINAVIDLGTVHNTAAVNRFSKVESASFRRVFGMDMRELGGRLLNEAVFVLAEQTRMAGGGDDLVDAGVFENGDIRAARGPEPGIGA